VRFEWTNTLSHENALFWGLWDEGFNWHTLQRFIAGYQPPTKPVPARNFSVHDYGSATMTDLNAKSMKTHDSHLKFTFSDVAIVIVMTAQERKRLARKHPELSEKMRTWGELPRIA
jgi:hypothetical protein